MMTATALVAAGGALGAAGRFWLGAAAARLLGPDQPFGTLAANVLGGLAMGLLAGWALSAGPEATRGWRLLLGTGVLGGFTTFSAYALETVTLLERREVAAAAAYALGSVVLACAGVFVGLLFARRAFS